MHGNQAILSVAGFETRPKAAVLIGCRAVWTSPAKSEIHGKIVDVHGNSGALRARFNRGLPGQALGAKIAISEPAVKAKPAPKAAKPVAPAHKAPTPAKK